MNNSRERPRHIWLGAFVLISLGLFVLGLLQSNAVKEWLNPSKTLRLVLPDEGLFGLSQGARIDILGTPAGRVTRIVIDPSQNIHAHAQIDPSMSAFVRRDSKAIIRKTFGIAGDSYVEITRGTGEPMDWSYAVLTAEADPAPTESIGEIMQDVRSRVIPILAQTERAVTALANLTERLSDPQGDLQLMLSDLGALTRRIERGQGSVGRLLASDATAREVETLLGAANSTVQALRPILEDLQRTTRDLPQVNEKVDAILASLEQVMADLGKTSPQLPGITRDVGTATAGVPVVLGATQQTLTELEALLRQLRSHWLLGGGSADPPTTDARLPLREVRP